MKNNRSYSETECRRIPTSAIKDCHNGLFAQFGDYSNITDILSSFMRLNISLICLKNGMILSSLGDCNHLVKRL